MTTSGPENLISVRARQLRNEEYRLLFVSQVSGTLSEDEYDLKD